MVLEHRDVWYMDEGKLQKQLCEERTESQDDQPEILEECCACNEAKYEVTFEGLWNSHTHPKEFPKDLYLTHFSDIIGASHNGHYRVWDYGGIASHGLKQVAEWGATTQLEAELKAQNENIRTIIKARGLWYPNVNTITTAIFRTDKHNHLMSLVSMLGPSPDWIVGVSGLELCLRNCTWQRDKILNLYPWDSGTDSGITYMSPNSPTSPQEKIRRVTVNWPNDERSPFYDNSGTVMQPLARLTIKRQRVYEKSCDDDGRPRPLAPDPEDCQRLECAMTDWGPFNQCSRTCGKGIRMRERFYRNPAEAQMFGCSCQLQNKEFCLADNPICPGEGTDFNHDFCRVSQWTTWSRCSVTCGKGHRSRSRKYFNRMGRKKCPKKLSEQQPCMADILQCQDNEPIPPECAVTPWTDWSPCTTTCGPGIQVRTRRYLSELAEISNGCSVSLLERTECGGNDGECVVDPAEAQRVCLQEPVMGPCRGNFIRWHYSLSKAMCSQFQYGGCRGNGNNFLSYEKCYSMCESVKPPSGGAIGGQGGDLTVTNPPRHDHHRPRGGGGGGGGGGGDCMVTQWSEWTPCSVTCGRGHMERVRIIKAHPQAGGKACPRKLKRRRRCRPRPSPCVHDCVLEGWSDWTSCSKTCGKDGIKQRTRSVQMQAKNRGKKCGSLLDRQYCHNLPDCYNY